MSDFYVNTPANSPGFFVGADPDWELKQQVAAGDAFRNGIPVDASGQPDLGAMATTLLQKGAYTPAAALLQSGIAQQQLRAASVPSPILGGAGVGATPATSSPGFRYTPPSAGFDDAVNRTLAFEGGLNPSDTNGTPSNYGINQAAHPDVDVSKLTPDQAKAIYRSDYWNSIDGDSLSPGIARMAFDTAVMAGPDKAKQLLSASGGDPMRFMQASEQFLGGLLQSNPAKYGPYANAWSARNNVLRADAMALRNTQPVQVAADDGANATTGSIHPYGGQPQSEASASVPLPPRRPVEFGGAGGDDAPDAPDAPDIAPGSSLSRISAPVPTAAAGAGSAPPAGPAGLPDPTLGGLITAQQLQQFGSPGGVARAAMFEAARLGTNPYAKGQVDQLTALAKNINEQVAKATELTGGQEARDPQYVQTQTDLAVTRARARVDAQTDNALTPVTQQDGTVTMMPKRVALAQAAAGNLPVQSLPGYVTSGQQALLTKLNDGTNAYQERQVAGERLDALGTLLSTYQTGANSQAFNDAAAKLRSFGITVPNSATVNPAAMQQFAKNAYSNVLSQMREQGNKQFVSEVQSAVNSNPSTDLQPEANAAMIAQMKGIQNYHDANQQAFANWYGANKGAPNDAQFQIGWAKANPLGPYIAAARKEIAPSGVPVPGAADRVVGQRYAVPGKGVFRWMGTGWSRS